MRAWDGIGQGGRLSIKVSRPRFWQVVALGVLLLILLAAIDLGMQEVYHRYVRPLPPTERPPAISTTRPPTPTRTPQPTRTPSPSPSSTPEVSPTVALPPSSFEMQKIQEALQTLFFRQQLLKASQELLRAEDYLAKNEMKQVERELIAVYATLEQAGRFAGETFRDTIAELQRDLSRLREDLYLRPERLQEGLRRLWQRVDVLIGE